MKTILSSQTMDIPEGVTVKVNAKIVEGEGPRGKLTRDFKHLNLDFELIEGGKKLKVDAWFGSRKTTAAIRTSLSHIDNLITGVTKPILFLVVLFLVPFVAAIKTSRLAPLGLRAMAAYSAAAASPSRLLLRQLFEKESSTYTYLLADLAHPDKLAVVTPFLEPSLLVDPVDKTVDRDTNLVKELGLKLIYAMNTHVHADHVTGCSVDMADLKWQFFALPVTLAKECGKKAAAFLPHSLLLWLVAEITENRGLSAGYSGYQDGIRGFNVFPRWFLLLHGVLEFQGRLGVDSMMFLIPRVSCGFEDRFDRLECDSSVVLAPIDGFRFFLLDGLEDGELVLLTMYADEGDTTMDVIRNAEVE
ncbi:hypothetical protein ZIOFF_076139 [Zingiber officinale]|uniref:Large ribosomal subunit protein uL6 alpha-beta domain-containing protein n=1 Tax=Zingiber officinale TaxID=94328 RepID=A0A8J5BZJ3_ZINOF|nr:hypothetical protein ZIOFF_076139 [Zingiber officinale]